ncbi:MAG: hypothetical protein ACKO1M_00375 [Planctomycetota bacterium]
MVVADAANLARLQGALDDLEAHVIAVPPFESRFLQAGHAVHFRCRIPEAAGIRLDVMAKLRGLPDFETVWDRRTTVETPSAIIDVLSLPDLVTAKKTQRDKDWPMIARLVEAHYARHVQTPDDTLREFWLRELRSPTILIEVARSAPRLTERLQASRPLLAHAMTGNESLLVAALQTEAEAEREADRVYWAPLKRELGRLRESR